MNRTHQLCIMALLIALVSCPLVPGMASGSDGSGNDSSAKNIHTIITSSDTLVSTLTGSTSPSPHFDGSAVTNGDFTIALEDELGDLVGDGIDESTFWRFRFTAPQLDSSLQVVSAVLTLHLTPKDPSASNDDMRIEDCSCGAITVGTNPLDVQYEFTADLLETYPSQLFLDSLRSTLGIAMSYQDDAIVSFAELRLVLQPVTVSVEQPIAEVPTEFKLYQNYPNPFNPSTTIRYELPKASYVTLKVFNVLGQEAAVLVDEMQAAGYKSMEWNASKMPSGVYFYRIQAGVFVQTKKLILIR